MTLKTPRDPLQLPVSALGAKSSLGAGTMDQARFLLSNHLMQVWAHSRCSVNPNELRAQREAIQDSG